MPDGIVEKDNAPIAVTAVQVAPAASTPVSTNAAAAAAAVPATASTPDAVKPKKKRRRKKPSEVKSPPQQQQQQQQQQASPLRTSSNDNPSQSNNSNATTNTNSKTPPNHKNPNNNNNNNRNNKNNGARNNNNRVSGTNISNNNNNNSNARSLKGLSHALAWALRHAAPQLKLTMTSDGYVPLDEILQCQHSKFVKRGAAPWTAQEVRTVVENCDKQRYRLEERPVVEYRSSPCASSWMGKSTIWCIRANQGHSIPGIDPNLHALSTAELASLPVIVHGTDPNAWQAIQQCGYLSRMTRNHIHCAPGLPQQTAGENNGVISGMRRSCQVYIYIDGARCAKDGIPFFRSDNGVLLTAGINNGQLPLAYVSHVTDPKGKILLDQRG